MTRLPPAIIILAAGASSRMEGADKLLEPVDGTPLVLWATRAACAVASEVIVVLPEADRSRRAWLTDTAAQIVAVKDRAMSASIRAGILACQSDAALIHLADMPDIDAAALETLSQAWQASDASILRAATADGRPGQPVVFGAEHFAALAALSGDIGAREIISTHRAETVTLPGEAAVTDLDTPQAWATWRARTGR